MSVFASLLLTRWPWTETLKGTPLDWLLQHPFYTLVFGLFLVLCDTIIYLGSLLDVGLSKHQIRRRYLKRIIAETEGLTLTGIPAGLITPEVRLDEVFIPLQLYPKRPLTDYPLTPRELAEQLRRLGSEATMGDAERILFEAERSWADTFAEKGRITLGTLWQRLTQDHPAAVIQGYPGIGKSTLMNRLALHMARRSLGQADPTMEVIAQDNLGDTGTGVVVLLVLFLGLLWILTRGKSAKQPLQQQNRYERLFRRFTGLLTTLRLSSLVLALQARWTLYSRRKEVPALLKPVQIPLLIGLGHYATERSKVPDLSLNAFLEQELAQLHIPGLPQFITDQLKAGNCLLLLDGLDEVSDQAMRQQVQAAIRAFLIEYREPVEKRSAFNRCLVTSRIAGYDQAAFPGVPHYTIAELSEQQIERFLPRWYQANLRQVREGRTRLHGEQQHTLVREAATLASRLSGAIREHQGLRELAENPLLLTLLAVMQQNSIELPRQRVELYQTVTKTLLENRNLARNLPTIPEAQALQRLGPLAFWLQEHGNSFARRSDIETMLSAAIAQDGGSAEEIAAELAVFLARVRERTGLFLQRTADYFGFYHRTFQEYFAARYLLVRLGRGAPEEIAELIQRARHPNDLWREPFLLAVAYKSGEDQHLASELIRALLFPRPDAGSVRQIHDLLLAAECVVEAKPLTIETTLQTEIAGRLLQVYDQAQQSSRQFAICDQIEAITRRWLLCVPSTAYRPPIVNVFADSLRDATNPSQQQITLTLLLMIARGLRTAPDNVLTPLATILLDIAGLTAQGKPKQTPPPLSPSDLLLADLALVVLSFLETRGPAGTLLPELRGAFTLHNEYLRRLASHSLERQILITPVVIPLARESYQLYQSAVVQWERLQTQLKRRTLKAKDLNTCLSIQQTLLACAEEIRYPSTYHLMNLLQAEESHPEQPWQQSWQTYLVTQLESGHYLSYQDAALLWLILFPEEEAKKNLFTVIETHYHSEQAPLQHYAQWFLARVSSYERHQLDEREQRVIYGKYMAARSSWLLPDLRTIRDLRDLVDLRQLQGLSDVTRIRDTRLVSDPVYLQRLNPRNVQIDLSTLLPTHAIAQQTIQCLVNWAATSSADPQEGKNLLTILLGRMLRVLKTEEVGGVIEQEIDQLCQAIISNQQLVENPQIQDALQELICYLPTRTAQEITLVVHLAEETSKGRIVSACAIALDRAAPQTPEARQALEVALQSPVEDIQTAVEKRLRKLQQEASAATSK